MLYSFFWVILQHMNFYVPMFSEHSLCSIFILYVKKKNNWDETARVVM